ncbi:MAG: cyclic nucleotide-binding domain-containing protein [Acidimicrobiales bacterium]
MLRTSVNKRRLQITDVAAFADLSPADKRALRRAASPMTYPKGATIQEAGSIDRRLVVVVDGVVQLDDGSQRRECGPGTAFGDAGSYGQSLVVTATALSKVSTWQVPSLVIASLAKRNERLMTWLVSEPGEISLAG